MAFQTKNEEKKVPWQGKGQTVFDSFESFSQFLADEGQPTINDFPSIDSGNIRIFGQPNGFFVVDCPRVSHRIAIMAEDGTATSAWLMPLQDVVDLECQSNLPQVQARSAKLTKWPQCQQNFDVAGALQMPILRLQAF